LFTGGGANCQNKTFSYFDARNRMKVPDFVLDAGAELRLVSLGVVGAFRPFSVR
jgi:hypothetical protein